MEMGKISYFLLYQNKLLIYTKVHRHTKLF